MEEGRGRLKAGALSGRPLGREFLPVPGPTWGPWEHQDVGSLSSEDTGCPSQSEMFTLSCPTLPCSENEETGHCLLGRGILYSSGASAGAVPVHTPAWPWAEQGSPGGQR